METPCFFARFSVGRSSVASSQPRFLAMAKPAKVKEETQYILQPDEEDQSKLVKTEIDLDPIIEAGLLHECALEGDEETELFVQIATKLDDGEAVCLTFCCAPAASVDVPAVAVGEACLIALVCEVPL